MDLGGNVEVAERLLKGSCTVARYLSRYSNSSLSSPYKLCLVIQSITRALRVFMSASASSGESRL